MGTKTRPLADEYISAYLGVLNQPPAQMEATAAVCAFLLGSGARISEALALRYKDVFTADGEPKRDITRTVSKQKDAGKLTPSARLAVMRCAEKFQLDPEAVTAFLGQYPPPKGKKVRLTVPFPWEKVGVSLIQWGEVCRRRFVIRPDEPLFSTRWTRKRLNRQSVLRANRRFLELAGVNPTGIGLHGLRKTFLRRIFQERVAAGEDKFDAIRIVQKLAGHARLETTMVYLFDEIEGNLETCLCRAFADIGAECRNIDNQNQ
jgi:integrase